MNYRDYTHLDVATSIKDALRVIPPTDRYAKTALAHCTTEINFLKEAGLLKPDAPAWSTPIEATVIRLHDLTPEGQDFIKSGEVSKWLGACDRKSNEMLKQGATEEARLAVYGDPKGLFSRLEKFRKQRAAQAH